LVVSREFIEAHHYQHKLASVGQLHVSCDVDALLLLDVEKSYLKLFSLCLSDFSVEIIVKIVLQTVGLFFFKFLNR